MGKWKVLLCSVSILTITSGCVTTSFIGTLNEKVYATRLSNIPIPVYVEWSICF